MEITINTADLGFTLIPEAQKKIIQKALAFYLEMSKKFNNEPDAQEGFELFDMAQLSAMLEYPIFVKVKGDEKESFGSKHGIDFPIYLY